MCNIRCPQGQVAVCGLYWSVCWLNLISGLFLVYVLDITNVNPVKASGCIIGLGIRWRLVTHDVIGVFICFDWHREL